MKDANDADKDSILREIRDGVRLIAAAMAEPLRRRLEIEFLTSAQRRQMYSQFDGTQSYAAIAGKTGVTAEAVRQLAVALEGQSLIVFVKNGSKMCPKKLL